MGLVYKELKDIGRSMYLYFPDQERRTAFKRSLITVLRDGEDEASVRELLEEQGMRELAEEKQVFYVDTENAAAVGDGSLPADAAADGIHLVKDYCEKWLDYLKTHTAP